MQSDERGKKKKTYNKEYLARLSSRFEEEVQSSKENQKRVKS